MLLYELYNPVISVDVKALLYIRKSLWSVFGLINSLISGVAGKGGILVIVVLERSEITNFPFLYILLYKHLELDTSFWIT